MTEGVKALVALLRNMARYNESPLMHKAADALETIFARERVLALALEQCAAPYFWDADGFCADATTPARAIAEMHCRQSIARAALTQSTSTGEGK